MNTISISCGVLAATILGPAHAVQQDDGSLGPALAKARGPVFAAPVLLTADGVEVNSEDEQLYPTPVLFDVDRDGATELVVGDLWGNLFRYERVTREDGTRGWGERDAVRYHDGAAIELPNW